MGQNSNFNLQLNDTTKRFTYFVPRDLAWQQVRTAIPSTYKVLFMPDYASQVSDYSFLIHFLTELIKSNIRGIYKRIMIIDSSTPFEC